MNELSTRIQLKRDTAADWNAVSSTFTLLSGELGFETDTKQVKIGVGKTWGETEYIKIDDISSVVGLEAALAAATLEAISTLSAEVYSDVHGGKAALSNNNKIATLNDISGLSGVIHLRGAFENDEAETGKTDKQAFIDAFNPVIKGDVALNASNSKEYLAIAGNEETPATSADIIELGDEGLYATKAELQAEVDRAKGAEAQISGKVEHKIWIDDPAVDGYTGGKYSDLSVIKIAEDEYIQKVTDGTLLSDGVLYIISSDHINAYGQQIINVAPPTDLLDATNKEYVDVEVKKVTDSALSAIALNGLEFQISNNKATLNIDVINCGTATSIAD